MHYAVKDTVHSNEYTQYHLSMERTCSRGYNVHKVNGNILVYYIVFYYDHLKVGII